MNQLSWLIYLSQVCNSLGAFFIFIGVVTLVIWFVVPTVRWFAFVVDYSSPVAAAKNGVTWTRFSYGWLVMALFVLILGNLTPTQNTVLAIAASQVGEQVVKNKDVQGVANEASRALQAWIQKQLESSAVKK